MKTAAIRTELAPHQQRVVKRISSEGQPGLVVAHGLGSGKTLSAIAAQDALGLPATVVVPASLRGNYQKELLKHTDAAPPTDIVSLQKASLLGRIPTQNPLLIVDEAHRIREPGTGAQKAIKAGGRGADKRLLLTASPFYNRPADIAPLINVAAGESVLEEGPEFTKRFVADRYVSPGLLGALTGVSPGVVQEVNKREVPFLRNTFDKWVDYHPSSTEGFPSVERATVKVPMTEDQLKVYQTLMGRAPSWLRYKVRKGLPPSKKEAKDLNAFLAAARQVSNTTQGFVTDGTPQEPKVEAAFKRLQEELANNPQARAVVYSNFLESGIDPYKRRLDAAGVPYGEFVGGLTPTARDQIVSDYNSGKRPVLLVSSAGGEGLDLKGTRLMQVLEPHWNAEKIRQVEGRGIRYLSHADLPEDQQKVRIENYLATLPERSGIKGLLLGADRGMSTDQYLAQMSADKDALTNQFRGLLKEKAGAVVKEAKVLGGFYKGVPTSPDTVKYTVDFQGLKIKIDRPKGFIMVGKDSKGAEWKRKYLVDYGFIPKTLGGDDDGLDVFIGPNPKSRQAFWVVQTKEDGSFDEYKVFLGFDNRDAAIATYRAHIPKKFFGRMITSTVDMMKAMLGKSPQETVMSAKPKVIKIAAWNGFCEEFAKVATEGGFYQEPEVAQYYQQPPTRMIRRRLPPMGLAAPENRTLRLALLDALVQGTVGVGAS